MPRPQPARRIPSRSSLTLLAAAGTLIGCTARGPEPQAAAKDEPSPPAPIVRSASELPARALPPVDATEAAPPLSLTASDGTGLRLVSIDAKASVQEPLAYTELHLVFDNPEDRMLEGRFTIDLPPHAAISRFAMKIGEHWQEGEVVERQSARVAYEDFLHRKQDPALMEKEAGNRFSARVFPIPARGRKELIVSYSQELPRADEPYRLPLRGLPRLERFDARVLVGPAGSHREVVELHETDHTPDRDLEIASLAPHPIMGIHNDDIALARVVAGGDTSPEPLTDLTILFDTSASRALGFDAQVRRLGELVQALRARAGDFTLHLAAFDQDMSLVFEGQASELRDDALHALYTRRALGASDLASALRRVATVSGPMSRVLVLTDGIVTAGEHEAFELETAAHGLQRVGVTRIDAIIDGGLQDRDMLRSITTGALPRDGVVADAELGASRLADKLMRTTLSHVDVSVEGSTWAWPRRLDGVQPGDEILVYASLPDSAAMSVVLEGDETTRTEVPLTVVERPLLQRAWTGARIEALQQQRSELAPDDERSRERLREEIVALSTDQRVLSDFTALLVLEREHDYERFGIRRRGLSDILEVGHDGLEWHRRPLPKAGEPISSMARGFAAAESDHVLASPLAAANDDEDVWGGLTGTEVGEAYGVGGLGLVGTGRGGGGTGDGTIGLGNIGLVGRGGGGGSGSGRGRGRRGRPVPMVRMAKAEVKGNLDQDIVRRVVRAHINEVRSCYSRGLARDPALAGRVVIQFAIKRDGKVGAAKVVESTLKDRTVAECIHEAVERWTFPKPPGVVLVVHPFALFSDPGSTAPPPALPPKLQAERDRAVAKQLRRVAAAEQRARLEQERLQAEAERTEGSPYDGRMFDVMTALEAGHTEPALQLALRWHDESPGDVLALLALGEVLERRGQRHAAARAYGSIIDLFPSRADLRRHAGSRLEHLDGVGTDLAIDTYQHAVEQRPDHPSSHRMLAFALVRAGRFEQAFEALEVGRQQRYPEDRFEAAHRILSEDLGLVAAAWLRHAEPLEAKDILAYVASAGVTIAKTPSTRFVMTWETDANDVDFHVYDGQGDHAYYRDRELASGGSLYADIRNGYGPECFTIEGAAQAYPYRFEANYFSRGPMGYGMGALQIVEHDGEGGLELQARPFVIMKDQADVQLGRLEGPLAVDR